MSYMNHNFHSRNWSCGTVILSKISAKTHENSIKDIYDGKTCKSVFGSDGYFIVAAEKKKKQKRFNFGYKLRPMASANSSHHNVVFGLFILQ